MDLERIWKIVKQKMSSEDTKKTSAVLARAETNMPLPEASGTKYESKAVISPIKPAPSESGGFNMTEAEKAAARRDAIGKIFSI